MAIDLNMYVGDIIKALTGKKDDDETSALASGSEGKGNADMVAMVKPFTNAIIFFFVSVVIFVSYFQIYYVPTKKENEKKLQEIERLVGLKEQTKNLENKILNLKSKLTKSRESYVESLSHFGNSEDLGALYQSVSVLASKYDLAVLNIKELPPPPPPPVQKDEQGNIIVPEKSLTEVKEIKVEVEIKGKYSEYMKFKEDLSIAEMLLKVNSENIKVKKDKKEQGNIFVTLNLSTYAIDKSQLNGVIEKIESK